VGSAVILRFFLPVSGLPLPLLAPRLGPCSFVRKLYKITNASTSWVPSEFEQSDLTKDQRDGYLIGGDQVVFLSTERIPKPPSGYRVMFLAFLLRGLSFPAHKFLRGLLFIYGVQLHQLTPNSILHIACFVTLCESFLGIEPHWIL
jgi:hypothetical protein